jgi:DNA-binding response OmpR family regulator
VVPESSALARILSTAAHLFRSGYGQEVMRAGGLEASSRTFIEKPFSPAALERAVEALLSGRPG